jgi:NitT/TauT family transport system substrate-binding protein
MRVTLVENFRAVFYAPFYAPFALGAYAAEGLDVGLKMSGDAAHTAALLLAGDGDVSWGGPLRLMAALEKNPQAAAVAFCEAVGRDPFFLIGREPKPPDFRFEHLLDRNVAAVSEVPTPWMCLQHDLRLAGIDSTRVRTTAARSMADNAAALRSGEADVVQLFHPYAGQLVHEGAGHVWYTAARRGPVSYTTLNTTRNFAVRHPDVLRKMSRAMYRTQKWIAAHSARELAETLAGFFPDLPADVLTLCYESYKDVGLWNRKPVLQREGFEWLNDAAVASGFLRKNFSYEDCVDMRFADEVIREDPPSI